MCRLRREQPGRRRPRQRRDPGRPPPRSGAKVIGEGANLGVTQRARIEFGLLGGACNSDAIDNSGGVNCSDVEVNIKIALASAMRRRHADAPGARQAARRDDAPRSPSSCWPTITSRRWRFRCAQERAGRLPASGPLHQHAGGAGAARPRGRDAAFGGRARASARRAASR